MSVEFVSCFVSGRLSFLHVDICICGNSPAGLNPLVQVSGNPVISVIRTIPVRYLQDKKNIIWFYKRLVSKRVLSQKSAHF